MVITRPWWLFGKGLVLEEELRVGLISCRLEAEVWFEEGSFFESGGGGVFAFLLLLPIEFRRAAAAAAATAIIVMPVVLCSASIDEVIGGDESWEEEEFTFERRTSEKVVVAGFGGFPLPAPPPFPGWWRMAARLAGVTLVTADDCWGVTTTRELLVEVVSEEAVVVLRSRGTLPLEGCFPLELLAAEEEGDGEGLLTLVVVMVVFFSGGTPSRASETARGLGVGGGDCRPR